MGDGGTSFTCLIPSVYSLCFVFTIWIYYIFVQDPDHILTGEGNATGSVAPNLAIWTTSVPHFHLLDLSKVLFYLTEVDASYIMSHLVVLNFDINVHSVLEFIKILCYITSYLSNQRRNCTKWTFRYISLGTFENWKSWIFWYLACLTSGMTACLLLLFF